MDATTPLVPGLAAHPGADATLEVTGMSTVIGTRRGSVVAVDDVSLSVARGEVLGLVGESGSGKSLTLLSILGLLAPPVRLEAGSIRLAGRELTALSRREWRQVRGREISMIFQEPLTSLDPAFTIGKQLTETVRAHARVSGQQAEAEAVGMLERVGIASARRRLSAYPHEFSGGMRQRVMIAMALVLRPKLLLADEPVTALDVTTQAQILDLIASLQREMEMAVILVSHDLGVVLDLADRVAVMYAGQVVEVADSAAIYAEPRHPYTRGLLASKLSLANKGQPVVVMPGRVPSLGERYAHCRFAPRCSRVLARCVAEMPGLEPVAPNRQLRCFNPRSGRREDD
jgi:oligopeptide/dipeptide ABC transporter ATP-binding protein